MISVRSDREFTDSRQPSPGPWRKCTKGAALYSLVKYELAFGGVCTNVDDAEEGRMRLCIKTRVFACIDLVTYIGPKEEMRPLLAATMQWTLMRQDAQKGESDFGKAVMERLMKVTGGLPLLIVNFHEQIMLGPIVPLLLAAIVGLKEDRDIKAFCALYEQDKEARKCEVALDLLLEGQPPADVLQLAASA